MYFLLCNVIKKNRMSYYYKTNNFDLIRLFCLLVESDGNASHVADKIPKNRTTVVNKIECLEDELKISLFKRIQGKPWILTKKGKEYYEKEAKDMVIAADKLFRHETTPKIEPKCEDDLIKETNQHVANAVTDKIEVINAEITQKIDHVGSKIGNILKVKNIIIGFACIIFVVSCAGFGYYLYKTNYFFDRVLYENASPKLKTIMTDGSYMISEEIACSFEITQLNLDMYKIVKKLSAKYKNIPVVMYADIDSPLISMRLTGDEKMDKVFKDKEYFHCNKQTSYNAAQKHYADSIELFGINKNFRIYNIYKDIDDCVNCKYFEENTKKYPKNIFGKLASKKETLMEPSRGWIIKYGDYYYLLSMNNLVLTEHVNSRNIDAKQRRYIIYKKMTTEEFRNYTYGSYWKMISEYNILFN